MGGGDHKREVRANQIPVERLSPEYDESQKQDGIGEGTVLEFYVNTSLGIL